MPALRRNGDFGASHVAPDLIWGDNRARLQWGVPDFLTPCGLWPLAYLLHYGMVAAVAFSQHGKRDAAA